MLDPWTESCACFSVVGALVFKSSQRAVCGFPASGCRWVLKSAFRCQTRSFRVQAEGGHFQSLTAFLCQFLIQAEGVFTVRVPRPTEGRRGSGVCGLLPLVPRGSFSGYFSPRLSVCLRGMAIKCRHLGGICSWHRASASHLSLSPWSTRLEAGHRDLLAQPPFLPLGTG